MTYAIVVYLSIGASVATGAIACMLAVERKLDEKGAGKTNASLFCVVAWPLVAIAVAVELAQRYIHTLKRPPK